MKKKIDNPSYCEIDVVSSISGRIRLRAGCQPINPKGVLTKLKKEVDLIKGSYCSVTNTFVLEYKNDIDTLNKLLLNFCGFYAEDVGKREIKVNYKLSKKHTMGYSSLVSLGFILLDLGVYFTGIGNLAGRHFIRWCALGTTIGAIFEHGYKELNENGAFDPEVMSIMYLFNSINKGVTTQNINANIYTPIIAWLLTFGRHILTKQNRSIVISTVVRDGQIKVIEEETKTFFFNQFIGSCFDVYQNVSVKRAL